MADITNFLTKIKTAIYGRDVRDAIHDSIEAINDDVESLAETAIENKSAIIDERNTRKSVDDELNTVDYALETQIFDILISVGLLDGAFITSGNNAKGNADIMDIRSVDDEDFADCLKNNGYYYIPSTNLSYGVVRDACNNGVLNSGSHDRITLSHTVNAGEDAIVKAIVNKTDISMEVVAKGKEILPFLKNRFSISTEQIAKGAITEDRLSTAVKTKLNSSNGGSTSSGDNGVSGIITLEVSDIDSNMYGYASIKDEKPVTNALYYVKPVDHDLEMIWIQNDLKGAILVNLGAYQQCILAGNAALIYVEDELDVMDYHGETVNKAYVIMQDTSVSHSRVFSRMWAPQTGIFQTGDLWLNQRTGELYSYDTTESLWTLVGNIFASGSSGTSACATIVIATDTSNHKDSADYIIGSSDDASTAINEAISLLSDGGKIVLLEGAYNLGKTINLSGTGITLEGMGDSTMIVAPSRLGSYTAMIEVDGNSVTIKDLILISNKSNMTGIKIISSDDGVVVKNVSVAVGMNIGIHTTQNANNILLSECAIYGAKTWSMLIEGERGIIISNRIAEGGGTLLNGLSVSGRYNLISSNMILPESKDYNISLKNSGAYNTFSNNVIIGNFESIEAGNNTNNFMNNTFIES